MCSAYQAERLKSSVQAQGSGVSDPFKTPTASPASMRSERQQGLKGKPSPASALAMPPPPRPKRRVPSSAADEKRQSSQLSLGQRQQQAAVSRSPWAAVPSHAEQRASVLRFAVVEHTRILHSRLWSVHATTFFVLIFVT